MTAVMQPTKHSYFIGVKSSKAIVFIDTKYVSPETFVTKSYNDISELEVYQHGGVATMAFFNGAI